MTHRQLKTQENKMLNHVARECTVSRTSRRRLRDVHFCLSRTNVGKTEASREDAPPKPATSCAVLFFPRMPTTTDFELLLHAQLTRVELKDIEIRGCLTTVQFSNSLMELKIDNFPALMHVFPQCLALLPRLGNVTLGTRALSPRHLEKLRDIDAKASLIHYGYRDLSVLEELLGRKGYSGLKCVEYMDSAYPVWTMGCPETCRSKAPRADESEVSASALTESLLPCSVSRLELRNQDHIASLSYVLDRAPRVEQLMIKATVISRELPFRQLQNLKAIKLWAKEIDIDLLHNICRFLNKIEILHFGGSITFDSDALTCLHSLVHLKEVLIANAMIRGGGLEVLLSLLSEIELHNCMVVDPKPQNIDRVTFTDCLFLHQD